MTLSLRPYVALRTESNPQGPEVVRPLAIFFRCGVDSRQVPATTGTGRLETIKEILQAIFNTISSNFNTSHLYIITTIETSRKYGIGHPHEECSGMPRAIQRTCVSRHARKVPASIFHLLPFATYRTAARAGWSLRAARRLPHKKKNTAEIQKQIGLQFIHTYCISRASHYNLCCVCSAGTT